MSEYEDARDRGSESRQKQTCLLQSEYDGSHDLRIGVSF